MDQRAVVALVVVLGDRLPVRRDLIGMAVTDHQPRQRVRRHHVRQRTHMLIERRHLRGSHRVQRVPEDPPLPHPHRQLGQPVLGELERRVVAEALGADQPTREVVGPRVVGAHHAPPLRGRALRQQLVTAVAAGVGVHPHRLLLADQQAGDVTDDHGPLGHRPRGPDRQQVSDPSQARPAAGEQVSSLPGEHLRRGVRRSGHHQHRLAVQRRRLAQDLHRVDGHGLSASSAGVRPMLRTMGGGV